MLLQLLCLLRQLFELEILFFNITPKLKAQILFSLRIFLYSYFEMLIPYSYQTYTLKEKLRIEVQYYLSNQIVVGIVVLLLVRC